MRTALIYAVSAFGASVAAIFFIYPAFQCELAAGETLILQRMGMGIAIVTISGAWIGWNRRSNPPRDLSN
jgi:hypothetical protein